MNKPALTICICLFSAASLCADPIIMEAEHGANIRLNFEIEQREGASNGLALHYKEGAGGEFGYGSATNPDIFIGRAEYTFTIDTPGQYYAAVRAFWIDKCGNQVRGTFENTGKFLIHSSDQAPGTFKKWYWEYSPLFQLEAGRQTFTLFADEDGPFIDQVAICRSDELDKMKKNIRESWPDRFCSDLPYAFTASISKPTEFLAKDMTRSAVIWVRRHHKHEVKGTVIIKGPEGMTADPGLEIPVEFSESDILKPYKVLLKFPKNTPRSEKKITVLTRNSKGKVSSAAPFILARPYDWYVLGPFDCWTRVESKLANGSRVDLSKPIKSSEGPQKNLHWEQVGTGYFNEYQTIDFEKIYGQSMSKTAYLYTKINVPETKKYLMLINHDCALDLWIDSKPVFQDREHHPAMGWLRQRNITLAKGEHTILVRSEQNDAIDGYQQNYWLFRLRIRDAREKPSNITGVDLP